MESWKTLDPKSSDLNICMGRIQFSRFTLPNDQGGIIWNLYRIEDDHSLTLVEYGFRTHHLKRLAKKLVELVL